MITIHTDGGARGNPGPAAIGIVIQKPNIAPQHFSKYIGQTTNNVAEYTAVLFALTLLLEHSNNRGDDDVLFFLDSQLVQRQLTGIYKIKDSTLLSLAKNIHQKEKEWGREITYHHIPREKNKEADLLVNQCLDRSRNA